MAIGKAGSSSLATVGPYIAEALVATAIGLFAAIPAVVGYNYFVHKIKIINKMVDLFVEDFLLKTEQE
jgi:biopolymer transport protein TolQ